MFAFFLLLQSPLAAVEAAHTAYAQCVTAETLRLGTGNAETADTILTAVRARCQPQWMALETAWPATGGATDQLRDSALANWRRDDEGKAIAALLEARAKSHAVP